MSTDDIGRIFLDQSRALLVDELLPRIRGSVDLLDEEDVWWRPNESSNSVGNLILHLAGNTRQWIISGVGGRPDTRARDTEFAARSATPVDALLGSLSSTVEEACDVLDALDPARLPEERLIQGRQVTILRAIYHVVEHFSMHTGQIIYIAKLRTGRDLGFYRTVDGHPLAAWERDVDGRR